MPYTSNFIFQDVFQLLFFVMKVYWSRWHQVTDSLSRRQLFDLIIRHCFPAIFIIEVPICVNDSIISLNISKKAFIVKYRSNSPVKSMSSWIFAIHLLPSKTFPELSLDLSRCSIFDNDPSVRAFTISAHTHISVQSKAEQ